MIPRIIARSSGRARPVSRLAGAVIAVIALVGSLAIATPAAAAVPVEQNAQPASQIVDAGMVKAAPVVGFNAENIISDALFYDNAAMTAAEIQAFLDARIGTCNNGKCLNVLNAGISSRGEVRSQSTGNLICSAIQGGTMKVSELIYRVQVACGISAKVILVTLQKEQGLTTSKAPSDWNLSAAMGASCHDTAPCDPAFAGVGPQILKGTQQLMTYKAARFGKQPGVNYIGWSPNASCGGTNLNIQNYATAALYTYTPYQPNGAALAAGFGLGDACSAYGNRNFYNYYTQWFGSTQPVVTGTPFVDVSTSATSSLFSVFAKEIVWLADTGVSTGWVGADGRREYRPGTAVTRDVMAAFLYRLAGEPAYTPPTSSPFDDVGTDRTFYREIAWLASSGISDGWVNGTRTEFRPLEPVSRDVMAAFLYRFAGEPVATPPATTPFLDVPVDRVFYPEIAWLASVGVSAGWAVGGGAEYRPFAPVTRDVMAAFLYRLDGYLEPFVDVSSAQSSPMYNVFASDIAWLASARVSNGWPSADGGNEYRPTAPVSRDVMAAFLYRLEGQPAFTPPAMSPFVDVPVTYPFYNEITWLAASGVSAGWAVSATASEFRPGDPVTRDVMAAFLYRLTGSQEYEAPATSPFVDVTSDSSFYKEISWLSEAGISEGWAMTPSSWEFRPTGLVTRDVMAAFLHRWQRHMTD